MRFARLTVLSIMTFSGGATAQAAFIAPTDWTRPTTDQAALDALTTYQEWDVFNSVDGPNAPDIAEVNPNGTADTFTDSTNGFVTSGNIYSFEDIITGTSVVPGFGLGDGHQTFVQFQIRTQGSELDHDSVRLLFEDGDGTAHEYLPASSTELFRETLGGRGGVAVETLYRFLISDSPGTFSIQYTAAGPHLSLDRVAVDTLTNVPEPASLGLLALSGVALLRRRRPSR